MSAHWVAALLGGGILGSVVTWSIGHVAAIKESRKMLGTVFGRLPDVCWLLKQIKNARELRALADATAKGIPVCPKCHEPMEFQKQDVLGTIFAPKYIREYKCARCGLEFPLNWVPK